MSNTELISMMCHDDAIVKLARNYTLSVPVRSLLEPGSFLLPPELFTFYPPGEGEGKGAKGGGNKLYSDACRFLIAHNIRFCGVSTMSWLYGRGRGMRISLGTNRSAKILSVLLLLKNKEIQYKFY